MEKAQMRRAPEPLIILYFLQRHPLEEGGQHAMYRVTQSYYSPIPASFSTLSCSSESSFLLEAFGVVEEKQVRQREHLLNA